LGRLIRKTGERYMQKIMALAEKSQSHKEEWISLLIIINYTRCIFIINTIFCELVALNFLDIFISNNKPFDNISHN
jgi:uncharacterized membrane protein